MNTISIIIPHHNGYEILNNCLKSLYASDLHNSEIIIVDNYSTDNSVNKNQEEFIKSSEKFTEDLRKSNEERYGSDDQYSIKSLVYELKLKILNKSSEAKLLNMDFNVKKLLIAASFLLVLSFTFYFVANINDFISKEEMALTDENVINQAEETSLQKDSFLH